jgi:hypothetical protein
VRNRVLIAMSGYEAFLFFTINPIASHLIIGMLMMALTRMVMFMLMMRMCAAVSIRQARSCFRIRPIRVVEEGSCCSWSRRVEYCLGDFRG